LHTRYLDHALTGAPYGGSWFDAAGIGDAGVDIFFVLSGFVIATTGPLAQPQPSGALFFWRRWRRVAPIYFIISVPIIVNSLRISPFAPHRLAATLLFWPVSAAGPVYPYLEPGWTLCFEMAFYTLVALALAGGVLRRNLCLLAIASAGLVAWRVFSPASWLSFLVNPMFLEFALGVALARWQAALGRVGVRLGLGLLAIGAGAYMLEVLLGVGDVDQPLRIMAGLDAWRRLLCLGAPGAAIVAGAVACERLCRGRFAGFMAALGDASYSIYLTNLIAMDVAVRLWRALNAPLLLLAPAALVLAIGVGVLVYRIVERPILRDLKRLRPIRIRRRTDPVVETPT
jgi:exopolysaccharide production protein ExoZ